MIGKIAVSAANFAIDKPYSYRIPEGMTLSPGVRVMVSFGRGNRRTEGVVLSVEPGSTENLKTVERALDAEPLLSEQMLRLAAFLRERCFCTFYDAIRVMLPAGLWFRPKDTYRLTESRSWQEKEIKLEDAQKVLSFLEDMGFYIVDNMPAAMILKFAEFCTGGSGRYDRVALVYDVRTADSFDEFLEVLDTLRQQEYDCKLLFLEASVSTIIKRYKETRRLHPLQEQGRLEEAVNREIAMMAPVRAKADVVVDSTTFSTARLRDELFRLFGGSQQRGEMTVSVESFGFKHGLPMEADLVFDVRFMPNPYYVETLRHKTGLDSGVRDYAFSAPESSAFLDKLKDMIKFLLPCYKAEGKTVLVIAIGCTGGHHRSVAIADALYRYLSAKEINAVSVHRDIER